MTIETETSVAYERARAACETAFSKVGHQLAQRDFMFGGKRVRMRSAGTDLSFELSRPFAHLSVPFDETASPELTIDVWDERATGVPYPTENDFDDSDTTWACGQGAMSVSKQTRFVRYDCSAWVTWMDRANARIIGWRSNAARLSMHERTRPLPFLLPVWYGDRNVHIIHAGLVAQDEHGVLFCGHNGAGKSTTSIACLCAGLDFLSDDHVGLEQTSGGFVGHSVFASTRLEPDHLEHSFPMLLPHAIRSFDPYETKSLLLVAEAMPKQVRRSAPISAIVLPKILNAPATRLVKASRAEALRALAPSTLMQMPFGATADRFAKLAELTMTVPAFRLELSRDISTIAPTVAELLNQLT